MTTTLKELETKLYQSFDDALAPPLPTLPKADFTKAADMGQPPTPANDSVMPKQQPVFKP